MRDPGELEAPNGSGQACLVDGRGKIVWTNLPWRRAGAPLPPGTGDRDSYLDACRSRDDDADIRRLGELLDRLLGNEYESFETEFVNRNAERDEQRFLVRGQALMIDGLRYAFLLHEDVTAARHAEAALQASEERYRQFFAAAPDPVLLLVAGGDESGRILDANDQALVLHGYTRDELIGRNVADIDAPQDASRVRERIDQLLREGSIRFEAMHRRKDGSEFPVEVSARTATIGGRPCVITFNRDITERRRIQDALRENQLRLGLAAHASQIGFWEWDLGGEEVVFSDEWKAQIGYAPDEIANSYEEWRSRVHADDLPAVEQRVRDYLDGHGDTYTNEFRFRHKNGDYLWIYVRGEALRDAEGRPTHFVGCHVDITAQREAEDARAEMARRISQVQRLESIGTLAGGIAHDFNNILSIISGNAQLALDEPDAGTRNEMLTEICKAGERARALVRQILAFNRREPPRRAHVALGAVVEDAVNLLRSTVPQSARIELDIDRETPMVLADAEQLHQVIVNLGTNAWHALGDDGGRITFTVRPGDADDGAPAAALLEVSDDGAGMPADVRDRIFEPFFTTKPGDKGTGLGLSVVHGIVQSHGGEITVRTEEGRGTTFCVHLPVATGEPPLQLPHVPPQLRPGCRVLLLDDETTLLRVLARGLERANIEVAPFPDPHDALAALEAAPGAFDVLVTDYDMPRMNGSEVARRARMLRADLPIVLCSGFLTERATQAALDAGATRVLTKPVLAQDLAMTLSELRQPR